MRSRFNAAAVAAFGGRFEADGSISIATVLGYELRPWLPVILPDGELAKLSEDVMASLPGLMELIVLEGLYGFGPQTGGWALVLVADRPAFPRCDLLPVPWVGAVGPWSW